MQTSTIVGGAVGVLVGGLVGFLVGKNIEKSHPDADMMPEALATFGAIGIGVLGAAIVGVSSTPTPASAGTVPTFVPGA